MSWFEENKFAGTLLGTTAVVSGVLVFFGMNFRSDASAARAQESGAVNKINTLQSNETYPDVSNEEALRGNLMTYAGNAKDFQGQILKFRPEKFNRLSPDVFNAELSKYFRKLNKLFSANNIEFKSKGKQHFGMGSYSGPMAKKADTAYLNYQRGALEWLFTELANSGIVSLDHVYRDPAAEILGSGVNKPEKTDRKRNKKKKIEAKDLNVVHSLPIEITFTGSEASMQDFLTKVVASDEYFFNVKLLKILNEKRGAISIAASSFAPEVEDTEEEQGGGDDDFGFGGSGGGDNGKLSSNDDVILKQVVGSEKITVFLKLDLKLFLEADDVVIPRTEELDKSNSTK